MPRNARERSSTNIYHTIIRGINKQVIFRDEADRRVFIQILKKTKQKYTYGLYAYVMMINHIHLLIDTKSGNISTIMQSIETRYAKYFNQKYKRVGYLFQNRFKSKCVESLSYLKDVQRYIHFNPQKANIGHYKDYKWSSYSSYLEDKKTLVDTEFILNLFDEDKKIAKKYFEIYHQFKGTQTEDFEMENKKVEQIKDEKALQIIKEVFNMEDLQDIHQYGVDKRKKLIQKLKGKNLTYVQIARLLGVNRKVIERAMQE